MDYSPERLQAYANACGIPTIPEKQKIWVVRTEGGTYYQDFTLNSYVALGWERVPLNMILDEQRAKDTVIEFITHEYPDEKRPGLIYSQLVTFACIMQSGDLVIIPTEGSGSVNIGTLGELYEEKAPLSQELFAEDYTRCTYRLRRKVVWHKEASTGEDIYLTRTLRSHQTIADISDDADLIYRNLYDFYFIGGTLSLTLRKKTYEAVSFIDEFALSRVINEVVAGVIEALGESEQPDIRKRTAISSPGFLEYLVQFVCSPTALTVFAILFIVIGGKIKSGDGIETKGLASIFQGISNLFNDKVDRDLKRAQARKTDAETAQITALAQHQQIENMKDLLSISAPVPSSLEGCSSIEETELGHVRFMTLIQEKQAEIVPIMQRMGITPPIINMPNNILPFHKERDKR